VNILIDNKSTGLPIVEFIVFGEPASKANSRQLVHLNGRPAFIKSAKARAYLKDFQWQCPKLNPLITGDVAVHLRIFYASRRPDLDESVILDAMQGNIYENDRQVKEKHVYHGLDKENPRTEIVITRTSDAWNQYWNKKAPKDFSSGA
jgi:Holliday junction resolvase RusA-like endonuclease